MTAIAAAGERVWTSGGRKGAGTLRQWSIKGQADCSVEVTRLGARTGPYFGLQAGRLFLR